MDISQAADPLASSAMSAASSVASRTLGKEDFLRLLIAQLRNQDPLSPMQNEEFVAQLAQFSSLEQMQNVNSNLEAAIQSDMLLNQVMNNSLVTTLIGKEVKIQGNQLSLGESGDALAGFQIGAPSAGTTVEITDSSGQVVRTMVLDPMSPGDHRLEWDGKDDSGKRLPPGDYAFTIKAMDGDGGELEVIPYTRGTITGVRYENGKATLLLGDTAYPLGNVLEILQAS